MVAKAGLGLIGLGAISVGGVAFVNPEWLGINREITWTPLSDDHNFGSSGSGGNSPYKDKFGDTHKNYLVGVVGKEVNKDGNKGWWDKAFEMLKDANVSKGMFAVTGDSSNIKVKDGYSAEVQNGTDSKSLNRVCEGAYKKTSADIKDSNGTDTEFKKEDVWKYCSPVGQEPKTVEKHKSNNNDEKKQNTIGDDKKNELISVADEGNKVFWEIRDKEFKSKGESAYGSSKFFQKGRKDGTHIKKLCAKAYTQPTTSANEADKTTSAETVKYCSLTFSA